MTNSGSKRLAALAFASILAIGACSSPGGSATPSAAASTEASAPTTASSEPSTSAAALSGSVEVDGSSTVYPITEAVAEEFHAANAGVDVTVGFAGTGGGFKKFCNGETDMNDASRPIKTADTADAKSEGTLCKDAGIDWVELGIATDALSVVVNKDNTWAKCLTTAQLKQMWDQGSTVTMWNQLDPAFPAEPIKLFGPGADSGTFDYFTEVINGTAKKSRSDYTPSEDDNALVTGVAGDKDALGYFGFAYLEENLDKIKAVAIDSGKGCIEPSANNVNTFVDEVGYIEATSDILTKAKADLAAAFK